MKAITFNDLSLTLKIAVIMGWIQAIYLLFVFTIAICAFIWMW